MNHRRQFVDSKDVRVDGIVKVDKDIVRHIVRRDDELMRGVTQTSGIKRSGIVLHIVGAHIRLM